MLFSLPNALRIFSVSNGVQQGAVISPILFSIYIDNLFVGHQTHGLDCHVALTYVDAFGYADDITLVAQSIYSLTKIITTCEDIDKLLSIIFNPHIYYDIYVRNICVLTLYVICSTYTLLHYM